MRMWRILVSVVLSVLVFCSFFPAARAGSSVTSGHVFFDYNGNGMQDAEELPLSNVVVSIGNESATTDESGFYRIGNLVPGEYHVSVVSLSSFKFMCTSTNEFYDVATGYDIHVSDATTRTMNIGLMEGFLTLPIQAQATPFAEWPSITELQGDMLYYVGYVDLDYRLGLARNYLGNSKGLADQHQGIDFHAPIGTPVVAAAPGKVVQTLDMFGADGVRLRNIHILHESGGRKFVTQYGHVRNFQVKEGGWVKRGQVIAEVGEEVAHLHFALWEVPQDMKAFYPDMRDYIYQGGYPTVVYPGGNEVPAVMDPYRDITNPESRSLWTKDNDPIYPRSVGASTGTYAISASAGQGGLVTPCGTVSAGFGVEQRFSITPDERCHIADVLVDGVSVGAVSGYSFTNITSNHTISVTFQEDKKQTVLTLQIANFMFAANGESTALDSPPIIKNGRTLVPIRAIIEALGGSVTWDATAGKTTVTLGSAIIDLWIGKNAAKVNGVSRPIDSANAKVVPEIINGRTMLPLRFVSENLGCSVGWADATRTITITYQP